MENREIRERLYAMRDESYRAFQAKLIPNLDPERMIGVRTPALRSFAKELQRGGEIGDFLAELPHRTFDENQLHAFLISELRSYDECLREVDRFLPYVDNWATCDQLSPRVFRKHREELKAPIRRWIASGETYSVRFGIGMLMAHYLEEDFSPAWPELVASVQSDEYYVNMMIAWYFATALAKQYDRVLPYLEDRRLEPWTHNKTIQKAVESYRISEDKKAYLKSLRRKGGGKAMEKDR